VYVGFEVARELRLDPSEPQTWQHRAMELWSRNVDWFKAVRSGDFETVKWLVWEVADLNLKSVDGASALSWAEKLGMEDIAKHLRLAGEKD